MDKKDPETCITFSFMVFILFQCFFISLILLHLESRGEKYFFLYGEKSYVYSLVYGFFGNNTGSVSSEICEYFLSADPQADKAELVCSIIKTNNSATVIDYSIINKDTKQLSIQILFSIKGIFYSAFLFTLRY